METTLDRLKAVAAAWGRADIETLMSFVAPDCVYSASVGPEPGQTFVGRAAVREGFLKLLAHDRDGVSEPGEMRVVGDWAVFTWGFRRTVGSAQQVVRGCDLFEFRDGLIVRKDSFRKTFA
jgi:ketosteroid isomerase-like protein